MTLQERQKFNRGNNHEKIEVLTSLKEPFIRSLKTSSDLTVISKAQGAVNILETLIDALS